MKGIIYFMTVITHLAKALLAMQVHQQKLDDLAQRERMQFQKERENEAKIAKAENNVVYSDLQIEIQKLKIMEMQRKLGVGTGSEWKPENYD